MAGSGARPGEPMSVLPLDLGQDAAVHRPVHRLLTPAVLLLGLASAAAGCSLDEAELLTPETAQVTAEPDQLRVLTYPDEPDDRWLDAVPADPAVFTEGDEFREAGSRTADDDEAAARRRLFTAVAPGRTLLVELNCPSCDDGPPRAAADVVGIHVWDLVVGEPDQPFSPGTAIARAGTAQELTVGGFLVTVRPATEGPARPTLVGDEPRPLRLIASHTPDDGAELFVDVFVAVAPGAASVVYDADGTTTEFSAIVR